MFLSTQHLSIGYDQHTVQHDLNLHINRGEFICVLGTNGCGKSTLFRTLAGLQHKLDGTIRIDHQEIEHLTVAQKSLLFSLVLTEKVAIENITVFDIVALGRYPYSSWLGGLTQADRQEVSHALTLVHLADKAHKQINELSDGERQRVMIAKALAQDTPLILLDEPTAHLDLPNRVEIMLLLQRLAHTTQKAVLLSTHELDLALQAADKIWLMKKQGGGVITGVPEDLVLGGGFQEAFATDTFYFNKANGNFSVNYACTRPIQVIGQGERLYWTVRALARLGFCAQEQANLKVEIKDNQWYHNNQAYDTLESLIPHLL